MTCLALHASGPFRFPSRQTRTKEVIYRLVTPCELPLSVELSLFYLPERPYQLTYNLQIKEMHSMPN